MSDYIVRQKGEFEKIIEFFKKEIGSLRIGRATPSLIENIQAESYGAMLPIIHLASITVQDTKTIIVQPWDKNNLKGVEKALQNADLGANISIDGNVIRLSLPPLTEETRKNVIKKLHQQAEESKVSLRSKREKVRETIISQEKNKEISEDEKFKLLEELDELIKNYNEKVRELSEKKEEEIMTI